MPNTHSTISIYTPSLFSHLSSPALLISCSELAHIILTSFSKPSAESRQLVSFILQSVHEYSAVGICRGLIGDDDLKLVATRSDLLMAVASKLEVDLQNEAWSGDGLTDVRRMYNCIINKLMEYFIKTAGNGVLLAINVLRSTLADTRHYLATSTACAIERDIAITAYKYGISYTRQVTIAGDETGIPLSSRELVDEVRVLKTKTGLKPTFQLKIMWRKKSRGKCEEESECAEKCETDSYSESEAGASDSGVSMGGSESDEEWGWDEEVGVAF